MPEAKPPTAPDRALNWDSEAFTAQRSIKLNPWELRKLMVVTAGLGLGCGGL